MVTSRSDIRNTNIHADIGATDLGAQFTADIRGCTDNSTRTSVMLRISKRISARTVRPGTSPYIGIFYGGSYNYKKIFGHRYNIVGLLWKKRGARFFGRGLVQYTVF